MKQIDKFLFKIRSAISNERGFTVVELLVVISVMAILATIVIVNFALEDREKRQRRTDGRYKQNVWP